jgi:hypothetical protein
MRRGDRSGDSSVILREGAVKLITTPQVCQWVVRRPDRLEDDVRVRLRAICQHSRTLATVTQLVQGFARLLRERRGPAPWSSGGFEGHVNRIKM